MAKGNGKSVVRKSTAGIPRVTNAVRAMDAAGQAAWLAEKSVGLSAEIVAEIKARLATPKAPKGEGRKIDFAAKFATMSVAELTAIKGDLDKALVDVREKALSDLDLVIAKAEQEKAALVAARLSKSAAL